MPWGPCGKEEGCHGGSLADGKSGDGAPNVLHGVVYGHARGYDAPWGVDVHANLYIRGG